MNKADGEDVQFRVLRLLEGQPHLSQREIAKELTLSLGGINYCLNALVQKGQIKVRNFRNSTNKIRYAYILTPHGLEQKSRMTASFLRRKMAEYDALKREISTLEYELNTKTQHD